jgi:hypothetical protein
MKKVIGLKSLTYLAVGFFLFLASCTDDKDELTSNDSANVENEAATDSYFDDADDMSNAAVWSNSATGRIESSDARFCAGTTITLQLAAESTLEVPKGTITIDFGTGCTDNKLNVRKGKVIIVFSGKRTAIGSTVSISFDEYYINGIKLEGKRTITNLNGELTNPKFSVELVGGKATWPDGSSATREVRIERVWKRNLLDATQDQFVISQSVNSDFAASGTNRRENTYQMNITKPLVYKRDCAVSSKIFIAVEGTKDLILESRKVTIDYGSGACDKLITITLNGESREVEVKGN